VDEPASRWAPVIPELACRLSTGLLRSISMLPLNSPTHGSGSPKSMLTIVMYHYVRDLPQTRFPRIKGLLTEKFEGQLDYISGHYSVSSLAEVNAASRGEHELPPNACVLTFDDGLADHYETVVPRLLDRGLTGAFFPSARPTEEHCVLDVHKIQFILAAAEDHNKLGQELLRRLGKYRTSYTILPENELWKQFAITGRFDPPETFFVKQMLQWVLPQLVRSELADQLFKEYVSADEAGFAQELYMDVSKMRQMISSGMEIGGHGYNHVWLGRLSREDQAEEIRRTVSFLSTVFGHRPSDWAMCYPFGSYNRETIELVSGIGCAIGLTTTAGLADPSHLLELNRLDTNDLPVSTNSEAGERTAAAR
jgi:peptidoglycan/xylan/chitin deacetylase (PgdA/CDA1 family)